MQKIEIFSPINMKEALIGFDIRFDQCSSSFKNNFSEFSNIHQPRLRYNRIWQSRFYSTGMSAHDTLKASNFREPVGKAFYETFMHNSLQRPEKDSFERIGIPFEYSWGINNLELWESLQNMLCRYKPQRGIDSVAAFTVVDIVGPHPIMCQDEDIVHSSKRHFLDPGPLLENKEMLNIHSGSWNLLGYDVGSHSGYSPLFDVHTILPELEEIEGYKAWENRNSYALFSRLEDALHECRLVNAYDNDDCPYFIWGVYEALNFGPFSLI